MSEVFVPRQEIKDLLKWGMTHPKFEPIDRTHDKGQPVTWAKERIMINRVGNLIFKLNPPEVSDIKYFSGHLHLERRADYDPFGVMGLVVMNQDEVKPLVIDFSVSETKDRNKFVLEQLERTDNESLFEVVEPDLKLFLGHLATIKSVEDFDWSEAVRIAADLSDNSDV